MARGSWVTGLVAGIAAGALAGGMAGWLARGQAEEAAPLGTVPPVDGVEAAGEGDSPAAELEGVSDSAKAEREAPTDKAPRQSASAGDDSGELFSKRLLEYAEAGLREGWGHTRKDEPTDDEVERGIGIFCEQTLGLPMGVGHQLALRRSESELALEDARTGGVFSVLKRLAGR